MNDPSLTCFTDESHRTAPATPEPSRARLLGCVMVLVVALLLCAPAGALDSKTEAETMSLEGDNVQTRPNANASGGQEVAFYTKGSASGSFDGAATLISLHAMGESCRGNPQLNVYVDGALKGTMSLNTSSFADYSLALGGLSTGTHTLRVSFENDRYRPNRCDRNAYLDYFVLSMDASAPEVSDVAPQDGAPAVAVSADAEAAFSEAMDASTISASTFTLLKQGSTTPVAASVTYDAATKKATLNPDADLEAGTTYTATIKGGANGVKDTAGNALATDKTWSFTTAVPADTTAPETTIDSGSSGTVNSASASFSFSSNENGSTFECSLDGAPFAGCTSPKTLSSLSEGSHTFEVKAKDTAGNVDASPASRTWTVDTVRPDTSLTNIASPTNDNTPTFDFSGTDNVGVTGFDCRVDAGTWAGCTSPHTTATLSDGSHTFDVRAKDAAGNVDATPASQTFTVDTAPPQTYTLQESNSADRSSPTTLEGSTQSSNSYVFSSPDTSVSQVTFYLDDVLMRTETAAPFDFAGGSVSSANPWDTTTVAEGSHTIRAEITKTDSSTQNVSATFTVDHVPDTRAGCDVTAQPGDNLVTLAQNNAAGTKFCLQDGTYTAGANIPVQSRDVWRGLYSDTTRPEVTTTVAQLLFNAEGSTGATIRDLSISGGQGPVGCKPKCGRGVHGGANLLLENVRVHHNDNQGVGGQGAGLIIRDSELDNNGYGSRGYFYNDSSSASAAGVKSVNSFEVWNTYVHDNSWNGVWCDLECNAFEVHDSTILRNGKSGVFFEISTGPAIVEGNIIQDNGDIGSPMNRQPAGLSVTSSQNLDAYGNTFGSNLNYGFWAIEDSRSPNLSNIRFHDNTMNGDALNGCGTSSVSCNNN